MKEAGLTPPTTTTKSFSVMGKTFDPAKPEDYLEQLQDQEGVVRAGAQPFAAVVPANAGTRYAVAFVV